jgi:hypothetical protein
MGGSRMMHQQEERHILTLTNFEFSNLYDLCQLFTKNPNFFNSLSPRKQKELSKVVNDLVESV